MKVKGLNSYSLRYFAKTHNLVLNTNADLQAHYDKVGMVDFVEEHIVAMFAADFTGREYNIGFLPESKKEANKLNKVVNELMNMVEVKVS
ncbi:MAG: hypothetical protein PHS97_01880 [Oscillospiraceae bacterium]|nr:hypothetical protein [Oscillospiraceae bacterium]